MKDGHLRDDRLGALSFAVEDDQRRLALLRGLCDLSGHSDRAVELRQIDRGDQRGWAFGCALHVRPERLDVVSPGDHEHAVAHLVVAPYVLARHAEHRVRGNEDDHRTEDHEPGENSRPITSWINDTATAAVATASDADTHAPRTVRGRSGNPTPYAAKPKTTTYTASQGPRPPLRNW